MNKNNRKSLNKLHIYHTNSDKNNINIDLSNNFHNFSDTSHNIFNFKKPILHSPVKKTIDELIDKLCNEFDEILKVTSRRSLNIDLSYNLLLTDKSDGYSSGLTNSKMVKHTKHNKTNICSSVMNQNKNKFTKKPFSYYLTSNNKAYTVPINRKKTNIKHTLMDIDKTYNDLFFKKHEYKNKLTSMDTLPNTNMGMTPNTNMDNKMLLNDRKHSPILQKVSIPKQIVFTKKKITIDVTLNSIGDLIKLTDDYPVSPEVEYNIDMEVIHLIRPDIVRLNEMIGMHNLKENILDQIIYFIQKLHIHKNQNVNNEFMHTVIYGPPGTGKTETATIIGAIYAKLGILKNNIFKKVTRADLIAGYLGQTALKTKEMIKSAIGGVLFIDEAYALGNKEQKDSFAKECIDTLCEALSNHKHELMVIIAGYEDDLNKCFFSYNQGLNSRFIWRFKIDDYTANELQLIFNKKVKDCGWEINTIPNSWFENNKKYFKYFGRDMETLLSKVKISHSRRVFCLPNVDKRKITIKDMKNGFKLYLKNEEVKSRGENATSFMENMYI
jgi:SpoVK/Ycf46/Vps4 family AAA+-type ATPase